MGGSGAFAAGGIAFAALGGTCLCTAVLEQGKGRVQSVSSLGLEKRAAVLAFIVLLVRPFRPLAQRALGIPVVREGVDQAKMMLRPSWSQAARLDDRTCWSWFFGVSCDTSPKE